MLIRIDTSSPLAFYDQVAAQVRGAIIRGDLGPGSRLPAAKALAGEVGINLHTVLRAYAQLRDEGLIELRPHRGAVVAGTAPKMAELVDATRRLVKTARRLGLADEEILGLVGEEL